MIRPIVHEGYSGSDPDTNNPPHLLGPVGDGGPGGRGVLGGPPGWGHGPTYISQNDPLVALIILNSRMWEF